MVFTFVIAFTGNSVASFWFQKMENRKIPVDIDYDDILSLRIEARQKLKQFKPVNLGQASRISGVSPADVSVIMIYLEHKKGIKNDTKQN